MPLGDAFVAFMVKAWGVQEAHRRESLSPKCVLLFLQHSKTSNVLFRDLLTIIGGKYDQYLDFRQQDAHEFLRHMLDAMRMEEQDVCFHVSLLCLMVTTRITGIADHQGSSPPKNQTSQVPKIHRSDI